MIKEQLNNNFIIYLKRRVEKFDYEFRGKIELVIWTCYI